MRIVKKIIIHSIKKDFFSTSAGDNNICIEWVRKFTHMLNCTSYYAMKTKVKKICLSPESMLLGMSDETCRTMMLLVKALKQDER